MILIKRSMYFISSVTVAFPFLLHGSEKNRTRAVVLLSVIRSLATALVFETAHDHSCVIEDRLDGNINANFYGMTPTFDRWDPRKSARES
jgi:hypothetical protein